MSNPTSEPLKFVYILSQRYSGSTLLSFLMATHPAVSTIGERRKFYNKSLKNEAFRHHKARHCSCGELYENCTHFNQIKDRVLDRVDPEILDTNTTEFNVYNHKFLNRVAYEWIKFCCLHSIPLQLTPFNKKIKTLCDFNKILATEILALDQKSTFLDTSKSIDQALYLSLTEGIDFRVVWLVRDPRAQINSALKYNQWTVEYAARHWIKEMHENEKILNRLGIKHIRLRYEDLCKSPEEELASVFQFVGLDHGAFSLDFRDRTQHIIGNAKMRLGKDATIRERKEWKEELSKDQIKTIERLTSEFESFYSN